MTDLIEPNWHPLAVHFVVAFLLTSPLLLLVSALSPSGKFKSSTQAAGDWMLALGILFAAAAIAAGVQAYYSVAHDAASHAAMTDHRNFAFVTGATFIVFGLWRLIRRDASPSIMFVLLLLAAAGLLGVTGWKGGRLVYHHGLGVAALPQTEGEGHDHNHGPDAGSKEAHDHGVEADGAQPTPAVPSNPAELSASEAVEAFHAALAAGDSATVEQLLAPDVIIFESGGAERSFEEYAGHHLPADMEFSRAVASTLGVQTERIFGDTAVILSERTSHGEFRGRQVHSRMVETMILRKGDDHWRITHIHWSSAEIAGEHEH